MGTTDDRDGTDIQREGTQYPGLLPFRIPHLPRSLPLVSPYGLPMRAGYPDRSRGPVFEFLIHANGVPTASIREIRVIRGQFFYGI